MAESSYSVVIPAFNAEKYLAETVASVLAQTVLPKKIIIVDDGSTDATAQISCRFGDKIELVQTENKGAAAATNTGIGKVTTPFVAFLDSDDLWVSDKMEIQIARLHKGGKALAGVSGRMEPFGDISTKTAPVEKSGWTRSTLVIRRPAFDSIGPVVEMGHGYGEMVDWIARAREAGLHMELLDLVLAKRRIHQESLSYKANAGQSQDFLKAAMRALERKRQIK